MQAKVGSFKLKVQIHKRLNVARYTAYSHLKAIHLMFKVNLLAVNLFYLILKSAEGQIIYFFSLLPNLRIFAFRF